MPRARANTGFLPILDRNFGKEDESRELGPAEGETYK